MVDLNFRNWPTAAVLMVLILVTGSLIYSGNLYGAWRSESNGDTVEVTIEPKIGPVSVPVAKRTPTKINGAYRLTFKYDDRELYYDLVINQDKRTGEGVRMGGKGFGGSWKPDYLSVFVKLQRADRKWYMYLKEGSIKGCTKIILEQPEQGDISFIGESINQKGEKADVQLVGN